MGISGGPLEVTFTTAKDTVSWDQFQIRTYAAICRHTALAQVRAAAVRAAMTGALTLPAAAAVR
jgi:hypothetical protein